MSYCMAMKRMGSKVLESVAKCRTTINFLQ